jgi:hypothetical protein
MVELTEQALGMQLGSEQAETHVFRVVLRVVLTAQMVHILGV